MLLVSDALADVIARKERELRRLSKQSKKNKEDRALFRELRQAQPGAPRHA